MLYITLNTHMLAAHNIHTHDDMTLYDVYEQYTQRDKSERERSMKKMVMMHDDSAHTNDDGDNDDKQVADDNSSSSSRRTHITHQSNMLNSSRIHCMAGM